LNPNPRLQALILAARRFAKAQFPRHGVFSRMGLAPPEIHILFMLRRAAENGRQGTEEGRSIPSALAGLLGVTAGNVSQIITGLEAKGFVEREPDPADRRRVLISLTQEGVRSLDEATKDYEKAYSGIIEEIGESECDRFTVLLDKAADRLGGGPGSENHYHHGRSRSHD
jgi:DNA-binding MarR family transcriptional regulator